MSGASSSSNPSTTKATTNDSKSTPSTVSEGAAKKTLLEEDDEFEDFPVDDWPDSETVAAETSNAGPDGSAHLWEESWDDDDTNEDFAVMLRDELKKMDQGKR